MPFLYIQKVIGWEPFKKTFRYFSDLSFSQVPGENGEILKLFLTKLKDYSGTDVLGLISADDIAVIEDWFYVTLEYVEPVYPSVSGGNAGSEITVNKGSYSTYQFTPAESANYYIYTTPYGGSGVSNDTYIEVYDNAALTGTPIASNDDYDGGRFSKVNVAMTDGTTYYIKVRHYSNGQLHAELNITQNIPVVALTLDSYEDINVANGEYALYSFTPENSMTYVFESGNYNGGTTEYDTYLKLYGNQSMTQRIGHGDKKLIVNLTAGHTYYLQFSGFLMKSSRGRISVRQGQTIQFTKSTDSNFIYVNSPEYLTRYDMVDDTDSDYRKIFEQQNVAGKNTFYETHTAWYGVDKYLQETNPRDDFYLDIDFYNPTSQSVTVDVSNLAYGVDYGVLQNYYNGGIDTTLTIPPYEHKLLFESLGSPLLCTDSQGIAWARTPVILFDFNVNSGNVVVSSLAAYSKDNLHLKANEKNILNITGDIVDTGEVIYEMTERPNESDLYIKYKGIAQNQSAWIDVNLEFLIDDSMEIGEPLEVYLQDANYPEGVANPKTWWMTNINPINDAYDGLLYAMPGGGHHFTYHRDAGGIWNFVWDYRDLRDISVTAAGSQSINNPVDDTVIQNVKTDVKLGQKIHFEGSPDEYATSLGSWGATYHYTVSITNSTFEKHSVSYRAKNYQNMILGYKAPGTTYYETQYSSGAGDGANDWWYPVYVNVPANSTITFEIVTMLCAGHGGTNNSIFFND